MAKQSLLVADADPRSLRILDVALRKAGFQVGTASDGAEALRRLQRSPPDLVLADLALPGTDGLALCRAVRADPKLAGTPVILISADKDPHAKTHAHEAGADDFLGKPLLIKELTQRIRMLLVRREQQKMSQRGTPAALTGAIGDLGLVDVFQSLDGWKRSAQVSCEWGEKAAHVWVRDGQVVDAETGSLVGEAAFYRLLHWEGGSFRVEFGPVDREARIDVGTQGLVMEAMRRVDEMSRLAEQLPLGSRLSVDFAALAKRLADLPDEVNGVLRLLDGHRSIAEVIDRSPIDDLATLVVVQRLINDKVLVRVEGEVPKPKVKPSLEQWLGPESLAQPQYAGPDAPTPALPYALQQPPAEVEAALAAAVASAANGTAPAPAAGAGALAGPSADSPQASFDLPAELARALTPPEVAPVPKAEVPAAEVEKASLQVSAAFAHADAEAALAAPPAQKTESFRLPAEPKKPVPIVRFPPLRGVRRERLRREADEARAQLAGGRPVRLTHLVELPAWPQGAGGGETRRRISPAVSDAAKRFAPDVPVAAVGDLAKARAAAGGAVRAPATAAEGMAGTAALLGELPVPALQVPDTEPAPPPAFTPAPASPPAAAAAPLAATGAAARPDDATFQARPLSAADLARTPEAAAPGAGPGDEESPWDESTEPGGQVAAAGAASPGHKVVDVDGEVTSPDAPTSPGHKIDVAAEPEEGAARAQSLALLNDLIGPSAHGEGSGPAGPALPPASGAGTPIPAAAPAQAGPRAEATAAAAPAAASPEPRPRPVSVPPAQPAPVVAPAPPVRSEAPAPQRPPTPAQLTRPKPPPKAEDDFDAEIQAALGKGPKRRWPFVAGLAAAAAALAAFLFWPQPHTDKTAKELLERVDRSRELVPEKPVQAPDAATQADAAVAAGATGPTGATAPGPAGASGPSGPTGATGATGVAVAPKPEEAAKADAGAPAEPPAARPLDEYARALAAGEALLKRGKYKAAVAELKRAVALNPESVPALLELGDAFLEADMPKSALKHLEKAGRLDGKNGRAQLLLGTAFQSLGKNKEAVRAYQRYLELDPAGEYARDVRSILANLQH